VRAQRAGHAVDQPRLAGAVGPDAAEALAGPDLERHAVERGEAAAALHHALALEQRRCHRVQRPRSRRTRPSKPSGARTTKPTSTTPTMKRFSSDEIVTVASCCALPSRMAPMTGPTQLVVPPIIGMASAFTA